MNRYVMSDLMAFFTYSSCDSRAIQESLDGIHEVNLLLFQKKQRLVHSMYGVIRDMLVEQLPMLKLAFNYDRGYADSNVVISLNENGYMMIDIVKSKWMTDDLDYDFKDEFQVMAKIIGKFCNRNKIYHNFEPCAGFDGSTCILEIFPERKRFCHVESLGFAANRFPCNNDDCYAITPDTPDEYYDLAGKKCLSCGYVWG